MNAPTASIREPARDVKVAGRADVLVIGGGPAGMAAAFAAARNGASTLLVERYNHLGGLASGGMVLVLDDMWDSHLNEISVRGVCLDMIERLAALGLASFPAQHEWGRSAAAVSRWTRWGTFDFHSHDKPHPICFAVAFDPDGWKRVALEGVARHKVDLRLHSWFSHALVEDGRILGVVCDTKSGRQALLGDIVIDTSGDLDVAASAGAPFSAGAYMLTTVFRLGSVDTDDAERFEREQPEAFAALDQEIKRLIGGSWAHWWLKTPLPGVVWCNCPHMTGLDGLKVEDLTQAEIRGRRHIHQAVDFVRARLPGFERCVIIDVAPQTGVRQTRLLEGDYIVTKEDLMQRKRFPDAIARGRDYTTPYRSLLPRDVDNLLVAGRHYSATSSAQKMSREIPPCMAMGEAAGIAAAMALDAGVTVREIDVKKLQAKLRAQGADPGDQSGPNADVPALAAAVGSRLLPEAA
jgi:hypothetical protein